MRVAQTIIWLHLLKKRRKSIHIITQSEQELPAEVLSPSKERSLSNDSPPHLPIHRTFAHAIGVIGDTVGK